MGLTPEGYSAPRLPEIVEGIRDELASTAPALATDEDTLVGNIIAVFAASLSDLSEATQMLYDSRTLDAATGVVLTDLVSTFYGIDRLPATPQRISVTLTGTPTTSVPAGTLFSDDGGVQFSLVNTETIGAGGTVEGEAAAVVTGASSIDPATVTQVVTPVAGLDSVAGSGSVALGTDEESDSLLRARALRDRRGQGKATDAAIQAAILRVEGVTSATVRSNRLSVPSGGLLPHSFLATVAPETSDQSVRAAIALAIYETQPSGIASNGDQSEDIAQVSNPSVIDTVRWDFAETIEVAVLVEIESSRDLDGETDALRNQIAAYINGLGVGGVIRRQRIECFALNIRGVVSAQVTLYTGEDIDSGSPQPGDLDFGGSVLFSINPGVDRAIVVEVEE